MTTGLAGRPRLPRPRGGRQEARLGDEIGTTIPFARPLDARVKPVHDGAGEPRGVLPGLEPGIQEAYAAVAPGLCVQELSVS
jgi:hypothetical protein